MERVPRKVLSRWMRYRGADAVTTGERCLAKVLVEDPDMRVPFVQCRKKAQFTQTLYGTPDLPLCASHYADAQDGGKYRTSSRRRDTI